MGDTNQKSLGRRSALPAISPEGVYVPDRASLYGEKYVHPIGAFRHALAAEGSYFIAHNPTNDAATTLAGHAAPVLADADATMTKPFIHARNADGSTSKKLVQIDFIEIEVVTAGASGTSANWAAQLDSGATRITSGGTALTLVNPNMQSTATPSLVVLGGDPVSGVESANVRHLGHGLLRPSIEIAGDKKLFIFGGDPREVAAAAAAAVRTQIVNMPPVTLGPTDQLLLALYAAAQNAAGVYKVRMGWWER
jgi:hypothetical protein